MIILKDISVGKLLERFREVPNGFWQGNEDHIIEYLFSSYFIRVI